MKQTTLRIITGLIILAVGVGALLGALNIFDFWGGFGNWWPSLIIVAGIIVLISDFTKNYIWGIALLIIGGFLLLRTQNILEFNFFSVVLPVIIIAIGLSVLINTGSRAKIPSGTKDVDDVVAILSGTEIKNKSQSYQGGKVTTVLGGATLDLRDAKIKSQAQLDVFVLMGGLELKVPRDWRVINKTTPIAGGVENKSEGKADDKAPRLVVTGTVALGGVEIKT